MVTPLPMTPGTININTNGFCCCKERQFEDDTELLSMKPGDCVNIPAGRRHRVEWTTLTEPTIWLVILYAAETG